MIASILMMKAKTCSTASHSTPIARVNAGSIQGRWYPPRKMVVTIPATTTVSAYSAIRKSPLFIPEYSRK